MIPENWTEVLHEDMEKLAFFGELRTLPDVEPMKEGEIRKAAVLFLDIRGFTSLAEKLSPDEVQFIIDNTFKIFTNEVKKFDGYVDKYIGDALMAVFGAQHPLEDDAEMAIRAGLGILEKLEQINGLLKSKNIELGVRIGVNHGEVATGSVGEGREKDFTVLGDTVNLAQRLEANSPVNSILVTRELADHLKDKFVCSDLGIITIKGRTDVEAARVEGINYTSREKWQRNWLAGRTKFIGREEEFETLWGEYQKACNSTANYHDEQSSRSGKWNYIVGITGDMGVGKSRLIYEFRKRLVEVFKPAPLVVRGISLPYTAPPYHPFVSLIKGYLGIQEIEPKAKEKLETGYSDLASYFEDQNSQRYKDFLDSLPIIGFILGIRYDDIRLKQLDPTALALQIKLSIHHFIGALALKAYKTTGHPIVLIFEDMQWSDGATREVLPFLLEMVRGPKPLFIIALYRFQFSLPEAWERLSNCTEIEIEPLGEEDCRNLISAILEGGNLPIHLETEILERGTGNPFFIEELMQMLIAEGVLTRDEVSGKWVVIKGVEKLILPDTVHNAVLARIDRLEKDVKLTLQKASVIGREFLFKILDYINNRTQEKNEVELTLGYLSFLEQAQLIFQKRIGGGSLALDIRFTSLDSHLYEDLAYVFKHTLTREVAYRTLLGYNKRLIHRLTAQAAEIIMAERIEEFYSFIAYHYHQAEQFNKALEYYCKAADYLKSQCRFQDALENCELALEMLQKLDLNPLEKEQHELIIQLKRAETFDKIGRYTDGVALVNSYIPVAKRFPDKRYQAECFRWLGVFKRELGKYDDAMCDLIQALDLSLEIEDKKLEMAVLNNLEIVYERKAEYNGALNIGHRALKIAQELGAKAEEGIITGNIGIIHVHKGEYDAALKYFEYALNIAQEVGNKLSEDMSLGYIASIHLNKGEYKSALEYFNRALEIAEEIGDKSGEGRYLGNIGIVHAEIGEFETALAYYHRALKITRELGSKRSEGIRLGNIGSLHYERSEYDQAKECFEASLEIFREIGSQAGESENLIYLGSIKVIEGINESGLALIEEGLNIAKRIGLNEEIILGYMYLGIAKRKIGQDEEASGLLEQAKDLAERTNHKRLYEKIQEELKKLYR